MEDKQIRERMKNRMEKYLANHPSGHPTPQTYENVDKLFHIFPYTKKNKPFLNAAKSLKILGYKETEILNTFYCLYDKYINTKAIPLCSDLIGEGIKLMSQQQKWNHDRIEHIITGGENCKKVLEEFGQYDPDTIDKDNPYGFLNYTSVSKIIIKKSNNKEFSHGLKCFDENGLFMFDDEWNMDEKRFEEFVKNLNSNSKKYSIKSFK